MAGTQSTQGKVVVEYVRRYPKLPKQTIAKLIMQEQPGLIPSQ